jgi:hypothetical protein
MGDKHKRIKRFGNRNRIAKLDISKAKSDARRVAFIGDIYSDKPKVVRIKRFGNRNRIQKFDKTPGRVRVPDKKDK